MRKKQSNNSRTLDMTTGSPSRLIMQFLLPLLGGVLFQQFYNLMDTIIVGLYLGVKPLAAVGATGSICFLLIGFCNGMCSGFVLPVAQAFGAKDSARLKKYVGNSIVLTVICAAAMTAFTTANCRQILEWMKTPYDIIDQADAYVFIIFLGIPATMMYNLLAGFLRSVGNSIAPFVFLVFAALTNIGLDLLFMIPMNMGVRGAALATVLSQLISGILCLIYILFKMDILHISRSDLRLQRNHAGILLRMGFPMGIQYSITAIGSVLLQWSVNGLGSIAVASMTANSRVSGFLMAPFDALGSTMATYAGQNVGAGQFDRLNKGLRSAGIIGLIYSTVVMSAVFLFSKQILLLFVKASETKVIAQGSYCLIINLAFYYFLVFVNVLRFMIQGMGHSGLAVFAGLFEMIARSVVAIFLVPYFGFTAVCFASPLAWVLADVFLAPAYMYCVRRFKRQKELVSAT
ncbi:MAG: MATE family efflux transporter [Agathobacter sp.]|uniref:MATE family efflux transporter n=1 Tax=Agathobacter sp. TaxID=2021311 RepID=UPI002585278E|nr:MATE family efflux transporter [Agathobacter sp.]MCR5676412.1 MATE family efflux transporter [Agathobacter sp.]